MAQVDFSNAVLDVYNGTPFSQALFNLDNANFVNSSQQPIVTNYSRTLITNTPTKVSILYTGEFTASGTEMYTYYAAPKWKISNISFSSGDVYSFIIDIEVSGNT